VIRKILRLPQVEEAMAGDTMNATILRFPGFLLADDGMGIWKDVTYHSSVDALMDSLPEPERYRVLDWNRRRFPEVVSRRRDGGGNAA